MGERCLRCPGRMEIISCSTELPGSAYDQIFTVTSEVPSCMRCDRVFADNCRICSCLYFNANYHFLQTIFSIIYHMEESYVVYEVFVKCIFPCNSEIVFLINDLKVVFVLLLPYSWYMC